MCVLKKDDLKRAERNVASLVRQRHNLISVPPSAILHSSSVFRCRANISRDAYSVLLSDGVALRWIVEVHLLAQEVMVRKQHAASMRPARIVRDGHLSILIIGFAEAHRNAAKLMNRNCIERYGLDPGKGAKERYRQVIPCV